MVGSEWRQSCLFSQAVSFYLWKLTRQEEVEHCAGRRQESPVEKRHPEPQTRRPTMKGLIHDAEELRIDK